MGPCEPLQVHLLLAIVGQTTWFNKDWSNGFQLTCQFFQVFCLIHAIVKYYRLTILTVHHHWHEPASKTQTADRRSIQDLQGRPVVTLNELGSLEAPGSPRLGALAKVGVFLMFFWAMQRWEFLENPWINNKNLHQLLGWSIFLMENPFVIWKIHL